MFDSKLGRLNSDKSVTLSMAVVMHYLTILLTNIFSFCRQIQSSLAPPADDPRGYWHDCRLNHAKCTGSQMQFLQGGLIHKKMLLLEVQKLVSECITIKPFNHII